MYASLGLDELIFALIILNSDNIIALNSINVVLGTANLSPLSIIMHEVHLTINLSIISPDPCRLTPSMEDHTLDKASY